MPKESAYHENMLIFSGILRICFIRTSLLMIFPYVRIHNLVEMGLGKRDTASKYLKALAEIGFLNLLKKK
jgi:Fic family protein